MRTDKPSFLSIFSSRKKRKLYYLGKEDFYHSRNALNVPSSFNFHRDSINKVYQTEKLIRFYGIEFGSSLKGIKRSFGRPNFTQKANLPLNSQVTLFYKLNLKGIKCVLQMHLFDDQLFFAQVQLTSGDAKMKKELMQLLRLKHKILDLDWDEALEDSNGGKITLKNDIVPKISYFSPDASVWKRISQELNQKAQAGSYWNIDLKKIALRWS